MHLCIAVAHLLSLIKTCRKELSKFPESGLAYAARVFPRTKMKPVRVTKAYKGIPKANKDIPTIWAFQVP